MFARVASQPSANAGSATRIDPLDWTKGALVLCMIVYHSINYSAFRSMAFQLLPFLPPSFVLIAGFVVGSVYSARYDLGSWKPYARLLVRGAKLLFLFAALNVGYCILQEHSFNDGLVEFADRSGTVFVSGNGRLAIFEVLLPISYFLLLVPMLLWLRSRATGAIPFCGIVVFVLCVVLERMGLSSRNLMLLSAGTLGMTLGMIPIGTIDRFARKWIQVLVLYVLFQLWWWCLGDSYAAVMFGATTSVLMLYTVALHLDMSPWYSRQMILLGRYSLLGYLAQIALLQILVKLDGGNAQDWSGVIAIGGVTTLLLFLLVNLVNSLRRYSRPVDLIYKGVFT